MSTAAKRIMDVEDALRWAYRDELPKRREEGDGPGEPSSICPMFRGADLGTRVENFSREPGFPLAMGECHPDALIIEAAVQELAAYRDHDYGDDLRIADDLFALGVDDQAAMRRAAPTIDLVVILNARLRSRPSLGGTYPVKKTGANGKAEVLREEVRYSPTVTGGEVAETILVPSPAREKDTYKAGSFCPVAYDPDPQSIVLERAEYAVWWAGIHLVAHQLQGKLATISILSPSAPQRPWAGEFDLGKPARVFESLRKPAAKVSRAGAETQRQFVQRRPMRRGHHGAVRHVTRDGMAQAVG